MSTRRYVSRIFHVRQEKGPSCWSSSQWLDMGRPAFAGMRRDEGWTMNIELGSCNKISRFFQGDIWYHPIIIYSIVYLYNYINYNCLNNSIYVQMYIYIYSDDHPDSFFTMTYMLLFRDASLKWRCPLGMRLLDAQSAVFWMRNSLWQFNIAIYI